MKSTFLDDSVTPAEVLGRFGVPGRSDVEVSVSFFVGRRIDLKPENVGSLELKESNLEVTADDGVM